MTYDSKADRIILFAGTGAGDDFDDTWAYDYNSDTWTQFAPTSHPTGRHYGTMTFDP